MVFVLDMPKVIVCRTDVEVYRLQTVCRRCGVHSSQIVTCEAESCFAHVQKW